MTSFLFAALVTACAIGAGCGKGGEAAEVPVNAPAGRVVEASGKVEATRGGATRRLAVGAEVFRDDLVATNDGAVAIELFHNQARWTVSAGKTKRVDESDAWGVEKKDRPSSSTQHATSAAGRNGERTAADTATTANSTTDLAEAKKEEKQEPALKGPGGAKSNDFARERDADKDMGVARGSAQPKPTVTKSDPPKPRGNLDVKQGKGLEADLERPPSEPQAPAPGLGAAYEAARAKLVACLDATTPKLKLFVTVVGGKATVAVPPGTPLTVISCLTQAVGAVRVTGDGKLTLDLAR